MEFEKSFTLVVCRRVVTPAQAGVHRSVRLDSRLRGNDDNYCQISFDKPPVESKDQKRRPILLKSTELLMTFYRPKHPLLFSALFAVVIFLTGGPTVAQENAQGIRNLKGADLDLMNNHDPKSQLENFKLLPGYQVNLFASDPMFANPVHMHWDSKGRLWVACSWAYPQLKPGEKANDKIFILEDTDNDGVADKSTVFADGLYLPTGIELANGGCYVAQ